MKNLKLKGCKNARDLGGLCAGDKTIKTGKLIRAGHLNAVTDRDINRLLNEHHLRTVIDLRIDQEKDELPDAIISGVKYLEMPVFDDSLPGLSHESKQNLDAVPDMTKLYRHVMNSACLDNLAAIVRQIVRAREDEYAILYHCTEGKDRTGMVTALLLLLLGVSREDIVADYLYTNKRNRKRAVGYYLLVRVFKRNKAAAKRVYGVFIADERYLNEVFRAFDRYGYDDFVTQVLRLTGDDIERFKKRILA